MGNKIKIENNFISKSTNIGHEVSIETYYIDEKRFTEFYIGRNDFDCDYIGIHLDDKDLDSFIEMLLNYRDLIRESNKNV